MRAGMFDELTLYFLSPFVWRKNTSQQTDFDYHHHTILLTAHLAGKGTNDKIFEVHIRNREWDVTQEWERGREYTERVSPLPCHRVQIHWIPNVMLVTVVNDICAFQMHSFMHEAWDKNEGRRKRKRYCMKLLSIHLPSDSCWRCLPRLIVVSFLPGKKEEKPRIHNRFIFSSALGWWKWQKRTFSFSQAKLCLFMMFLIASQAGNFVLMISDM